MCCFSNINSVQVQTSHWNTFFRFLRVIVGWGSTSLVDFTLFALFIFFFPPFFFKPPKNVCNERSPSLHSCSSGTLSPDSSSSSSAVPSDPHIQHGTALASSGTGKFQKMLEYHCYCSFKEIIGAFALIVSLFGFFCFVFFFKSHPHWYRRSFKIVQKHCFLSAHH